MQPLFNMCALALVIAQIVLPRRLGFLPLLIAVFHLPNVSILGIGGGDFSITRLLIGVGLIRASLTGNLAWSWRHPLDLLVAVWSGIALLSFVAHHSEDGSPLIFRMGLVYNVAGAYLYARAFIPSADDFRLFAQSLVLVLIPLAFLMILDNATGRNPYSVLGGVREFSAIREGRVRSQGPFAHAILAGTAGATSFLLVLSLWRDKRRHAMLGLVSCACIVLTCGSSGPLLTVLAGLTALGLWRWRTRLRLIRWCLLLTVIALHLIMKAPVWYLLARIDVVGGSTGWHRAELITAGLRHLNEWWLAGTDVTRHWMPTGVSWSPDHTDITNHYLKLGVIGGLPLLFAFIAILGKGFQLLGRRMAELRAEDDPAEFVLWCVGGTLLMHSATFLSVSYFDQINVFFWLLAGVVPGLCARGETEAQMASRGCSGHPSQSFAGDELDANL